MTDGGSFHATAIAFTYNNPEESGDELRAILEPEGYKYVVFQLEEGAEHTPHFQGYIHFGKQKRIGPRFRSLFKGTIWAKAARGGPAQNRVYCTKEEGRKGGPWEIGECPQGQGARTDLTEFYNEVRSGKRARELADEYHTILAKYPRFYSTILGLQMPVLRADGVRCVLSYGRTGVGKTREVISAHEGSPEFFRAPLGNGFWMDGYDGQKVVLLDDFAGAASKISLGYLLQILDRYPVQVPVKGAFTWWYPEVIHVTTNIHPRDWYKWDRREEQYSALMRRFATIKNDLVELDVLSRAQFTAYRPVEPEAPVWPPQH